MCKWSQASFDQARINTMVSLEIKTLAAMSEEMRENSEMENIQIKKRMWELTHIYKQRQKTINAGLVQKQMLEIK